MRLCMPGCGTAQQAACACPPPPHPLAQSERNSLQTSLGEARRAAAAAREQHERLLLEHEADARAREGAVLEANARELADLREAGLRCEAGGAGLHGVSRAGRDQGVM